MIVAVCNPIMNMADSFVFSKDNTVFDSNVFVFFARSKLIGLFFRGMTFHSQVFGFGYLQSVPLVDSDLDLHPVVC